MSGRRWTAQEDEVVRTNPTKVAAYLLRKSRTICAVRDRRRHFGMLMAPACWVNRRWTASEDEIIKSNSIRDAIELLKAARTEQAVRLRRRAIGASTPKNTWTKIEDRRILRTAHLPLSRLPPLFKNRTACAISARRYDLGCQRKRGPLNAWKGTELKLLRRMWPSCEIAEIVASIPRHKIEAIRSKAVRLGLRKVAAPCGSSDLLDQIRARSREDGISLTRLAAQLGFGVSFLRARTNPRLDLKKIAAAVEFFGGRLAIDWQDK